MVLAQTVTVVNKSGRVVSTGKHLVNVFKEAKSAYRERKAEITAIRDAEEIEKKARKAMRTLAIEDDNVSRTSSRRSHRSSRSSRDKQSRRDKPPMERGYTDSFYANEQGRRSHQRPRESGLRYEYHGDANIERNELVRRHTDVGLRQLDRPKTSRSASMSDIDMDLAYGDLPPPLPERHGNEEIELRSKMMSLQQLLDEADCMHTSVISMIDNLQKNPDALAAVALTLGEISTLASKLAPGMLMSMKGAFPAAIALLLSPEFMIAAGVGIGVTVIMLGGYKIIKKVKQMKDDKKLLEAGSETSESVTEYDELREINSDLSRIEMWRRGIADAEASGISSHATSVEGEFVTPGANKYLIEEGVLQDDLKSTRSGKTSRSKKNKKEAKQKEKEKVKATKKASKKEPSGLRMLFKSR